MARRVITSETGVFPGIPDSVYHRDHDSLSSSGARDLLRTTPRAWRRAQVQGRADKRHYDVGHVFHGEVLGEGVATDEQDQLPIGDEQ